MKNLVIVESPAKAKTIKKFLGDDFFVGSSYGHIRDLVKKDKGIDINNGFNPIYEISEKSKKVVSNLRKLTNKVEKVWLATDEDREGEAIAWHISQVLNLDIKEKNRITFNEITRKAVLSAVQSSRKISQGLVNAQQARRVLDRLVGFELSPVLWRKIRTGLSAGRVQSVAVRLVIERERERKAFTSKKEWRIEAEFTHDNQTFKGRWDENITDENIAREVLENALKEKLQVLDIQQKPSKKSPQGTLTTSLLQQAAAQGFGFPVKKTMSLAQRLYEAGHITYMRTDSQTLSDEAMQNIKQWVLQEYGDSYYQARTYKTKSANAQEAHEAIRPTNISVPQINASDPGQVKLYSLIWKRTVMSQMADAKMQKTVIQLGSPNWKNFFIVRGERITFSGWLELSGKLKEKVLPEINQKDVIKLSDLYAREIFSKSPAQYTEASLVRRLEELGIGRPSTYAPTISTIQDRGYVLNQESEPKEQEFLEFVLEQGKLQRNLKTELTGGGSRCLMPTDIAFVVNDFLVKQFSDVVDYGFTAKLESSFDDIAKKDTNWQKMVADFYKPFHEKINQADKIERQEINHTRYLGTDLVSGKPISVKIGRYGPMAQIGERDDEEKPQFAGLKKGQSVDTITLEEATKLFELPRFVGLATHTISYQSVDNQDFVLEKDTEIKANLGRFGPYLQFGTKRFASLKECLPETITIKEAMTVIDEKLKKDAEKLLIKFGDIQVLKGYWGAFATDGKKQASIGKNTDVTELTEAKIKKILKEKGKRIKAGKSTTRVKKVLKKVTKK